MEKQNSPSPIRGHKRAIQSPEQRSNTFIGAIESFSGPLPPPKHIEEYERIYPGAAKIIFDMAQDQLHHRQGLEDKVIGSNIRNEKSGMWFAFTSTVFIVFLGFYLIYTNKSVPVGFFTILAPVLAQGANFYFSKKNERAALEKKDKQIEPTA